MVAEVQIASSFERILELQDSYSSRKTAEMAERGSLLTEIAADLKSALTSADGEIVVRASNGAGNSAKVPWVNLADPAKSKSPMSGFYLVYLFAADGSALYLSLALGVTKLDRRTAAAMVARGREGLASQPAVSTSTPLVTKIDLADGGLGRQYEHGAIEALRYERGNVPTDAELRRDLEAMILRMASLPSSLAGPQATSSDGLAFEYVPPHEARVRELARSISWTEAKTEELLDVLASNRPQVVLYGPPGTGKSFVAKRAAVATIGSDDAGRSRLVQFHPSYGYEEFVEGLRPSATENSALEFVRTPGVLLRLAEEIDEDALERVLIIDEMNRANLPRVFGELLYLLEYRDESIQLMLERSFRLPPELKLIGTMNTADRSAQSLDVALRRRFEFFEVEPNVEVLHRHYGTGADNRIGPALFDGFVALNEQLQRDLGSKDLLIGHSYFMKDVMDERTLAGLVRRQLAPLLEDYFFLDRSRINGYRWDELFKANV